MKKNLRLLLFAVLVVVTLAVMAFTASATEPPPAEDDYFQVVDASSAHVGYYKTFAEAQEAVAADGYTIKLLKDTPIGAADWSFSKNVTLDGCGFRILVDRAPIGKNPAAILIPTGDVTIKNVTLVEDGAVKSGTICSYALRIDSGGTILFENFNSLGFDSIVIFAGPANVTFNNCDLGKVNAEGNPGYHRTFRCYNGSAGGTITINSGFYTANYTVFQANGADIIINGGTFTVEGICDDSHYIIISSDSDVVPNVTITGGNFSVSATDTGTADWCYAGIIRFSGSGGNNTYNPENGLVNITGGDFVISGRYSRAFMYYMHASPLSAEHTVPFNINGGKVTVKDGAYLALYRGGGKFPMNFGAVEVVFDGGAYGISVDDNYGGSVNISEGFSAVDAGKKAELIYANWSKADTTVNITGGTFTGFRSWIGEYSHGAPICISGGTFKDNLATAPGINLPHESSGAKVTISGGTFSQSEGGVLIAANGADLEISGGTFTTSGKLIFMNDSSGSASASPVTISGGVFNAGGADAIITATSEGQSGSETPLPGGLIILGGEFHYTGSGQEMFLIHTGRDGFHMAIRGGTFHAGNARVLTYEGGTATNRASIVDGVFESSGSAVIFLGASPVAFQIAGGTFILSGEGAAPDAVLLLATEADGVANLLIKGGTFVDERTGNRQVILNKSPNTVTFEGGTLLSDTLQEYFYFKAEDTAASVAMTAESPQKEYEGKQYYAQEYTVEVVPVEAYFEILDAAGQFVTKVNTFSEAVAAVAEGGTVKLLADTPIGDADWDFTGNFTFDGGGFSILIDRKGLVNDAPIKFFAGNLTFKNVVLVEVVSDGNFDVCSYATRLESADANVTFEGVTSDGFTSIIIMAAPGHITLNSGCRLGYATYAGNETERLVRLYNGSAVGTLTVNDGEYFATNFVFQANGADIIIHGGTFTSEGPSTAGHYIVHSGDNDVISSLLIEGGTFNAISHDTAGGDYYSAVIRYQGQGVCKTYNPEMGIVNVTGGTFNIYGGENRGFMYYTTKNKTEAESMPFNIRGGVFNVDGNAYLTLYRGGRNFPMNFYGGTYNLIDCQEAFSADIASGGVINFYDGEIHADLGCYVFCTEDNCNVEYNIHGGTLVGGKCWIFTSSPSLINVTGGTFADNAQEYRSIRLCNGSRKGGVLNISGGTFTQSKGDTIFINAAGADLNISGGVFTTAGKLISMHDSCTSKVNISGGEFNSNSYDALILYCGDEEEGYPDGFLTITDGVFNYTGNAAMFELACRGNEAGCDISGGTFYSSLVRVFYVRDSSETTRYRISGGHFTSDSGRVIYMDSFKGQMIIDGGTFLLPEMKQGKEAHYQDAVIYMFCKGGSHLTINGGTFIDERSGNGQVIRNESENIIDINGGIFLSHEMQDYFYFSDDNYAVPMRKDAETVKLDGKVYYALSIIPSNAGGAAPYIESVKTARINEDSMGMRFTSFINKEVAAKVKDFLQANEGSAISYGTVIMPLENFKKLTVRNGAYHEAIEAYIKAEQIADATTFYADVAATEKGITVSEKDGSILINAALVHIKQENKAKEFMAFSYIKITNADGSVEYAYSAINESGCHDNMGEVAKRALADVHGKREEVRDGNVKKSYAYPSVMEEGKFSRLNEAQQNALKAYLPAA